MSTRIEWTNQTWNPTTGCDRVSDGCDNCYALIMAARLKAMGSAKYQTDGNAETSGPGFGVATHVDTLRDPLGWLKPRRVFVNSMSDLFHDRIPVEFIASVWAIMAATPQHTYQILTKRHARMRSVLRSPEFAYATFRHMAKLSTGPASLAPLRGALPNVWLGVSIENQDTAERRIPALLDTPAQVRFLSCEPLLGPVDLTNLGTRHGPPINVLRPHRAGAVSWVIAGGESGKKARPSHPAWFRSLRDQCRRAGVPWFFKQWGNWSTPDPSSGHEIFDYVTDDDRVQVVSAGGVLLGRPWGGWARQDSPTRDAAVMRRYSKQVAGRLLDGQTWDEYPEGMLTPCPG